MVDPQHSILPPQPDKLTGCLGPAVAGLVTYLVTAAAGLIVTVWIVRSIPPEVPNPTEAFEALGDAINAMFYFMAGLVVSQFVASGLAFVAAAAVASRSAKSLAVQRPNG